MFIHSDELFCACRYEEFSPVVYLVRTHVHLTDPCTYGLHTTRASVPKSRDLYCMKPMPEPRLHFTLLHASLAGTSYFTSPAAPAQ